MILSAILTPFRLVRWLFGATARNVWTALVQIWANKGRAILTTLGIIIAVTSIITVITFVEGFGNHITNMFQGYGTKFIGIYPDGFRNRSPGMRRVRMTEEDLVAVRAGCPAVRRITPFLFAEVEISFGADEAEEIPLRGTNEQYQTLRNFPCDAGRFFSPIEVEYGAYVCVLGRTVLKRLEADETIVGQYVYIGDMRFQVIGVLERKGSFLGEDQDETIIIPYTTFLRLYPRDRDLLVFLAESSEDQEVDDAVEQIRRVLRLQHDLQPGMADDFFVMRQDQFISSVQEVRQVATGILAGIVSISLLVGGIGIMNVMLVSVTERTREIGLRKSIGGRRRDILLQFLTEAVVLCLVGGLVGVVLGYVITSVAALHPQMMAMSVPLWSVALALSFSAGTGIVFGIIPAFKAAILHPIDALRHE